jgi:hypothetical protein
MANPVEGKLIGDENWPDRIGIHRDAASKELADEIDICYPLSPLREIIKDNLRDVIWAYLLVGPGFENDQRWNRNKDCLLCLTTH